MTSLDFEEYIRYESGPWIPCAIDRNAVTKEMGGEETWRMESLVLGEGVHGPIIMRSHVVTFMDMGGFPITGHAFKCGNGEIWDATNQWRANEP